MRLERVHSDLCKHAGYTCVDCLASTENPYYTVWVDRDGSRPGWPIQRTLTGFALIKRALESWFIPYAWPGGYTVVFTTDDGDTLCAECAKRAFLADKLPAITADLYDEGPTLQCDACGRDLESSYGDPEEESDND